MRRHRTTARSILAAVILAVVAGTAGAAKPPAHIVFPVVGMVQYTDDFGAPRAGGPHQGIDIMAPRKALAVAAESGRVKFWATSRNAGCMLYLYGQSGTTYLYIHLNNDLTAKNDNRGKCVAGVAYAAGLKSGARVAAGEQVGFVGDSGDANGIHPHLHFEVHPNGKAAVNPFPYLNAAEHLLFAAPVGTPFVLVLTGKVVAAAPTKLTMSVSLVQAWPMNLRQTKLNRTVTIGVPAAATVQSMTGSVAKLLTSYKGESVVVWTQPAPTTLRAQRGDDGALTAALVQLGP
jgi:hypothetical protein